MDAAAERQRVLEKVAQLVVEVVGDDAGVFGDIRLETSFGRDLELESIELVALAEKLQTTYGREVDFAGWLATKTLDEIIGLTVGELVEFIVRCRSSTPAA